MNDLAIIKWCLIVLTCEHLGMSAYAILRHRKDEMSERNNQAWIRAVERFGASFEFATKTYKVLNDYLSSLKVIHAEKDENVDKIMEEKIEKISVDLKKEILEDKNEFIGEPWVQEAGK